MEFAEHIKTANVENVVLTQQLGMPLKGTLCVTSHHLLLFARDGDSTAQLLLLLRNIDAVEKRRVAATALNQPAFLVQGYPHSKLNSLLLVFLIKAQLLGITNPISRV